MGRKWDKAISMVSPVRKDSVFILITQDLTHSQPCAWAHGLPSTFPHLYSYSQKKVSFPDVLEHQSPKYYYAIV